MKLPRLRQGDMIEVVWTDACVHKDGGWMMDDEETDELIVVTLGFYHSKTKELLKMYASSTGNGLQGLRIDIPVGCINSISKLTTV